MNFRHRRRLWHTPRFLTRGSLACKWISSLIFQIPSALVARASVHPIVCCSTFVKPETCANTKRLQFLFCQSPSLWLKHYFFWHKIAMSVLPLLSSAYPFIYVSFTLLLFLFFLLAILALVSTLEQKMKWLFWWFIVLSTSLFLLSCPFIWPFHSNSSPQRHSLHGLMRIFHCFHFFCIIIFYRRPWQWFFILSLSILFCLSNLNLSLMSSIHFSFIAINGIPQTWCIPKYIHIHSCRLVCLKIWEISNLL